MADLITALWAGDQEGLDPQLYNVALLDQRRQEASKGFLTKKGFEPREAGDLDVWLTYLYMKYASDLADGLSDLAHADPTWQIKREKFDPRAWLEKALAANAVAASLQELTPRNPQYRGTAQGAGRLPSAGRERRLAKGSGDETQARSAQRTWPRSPADCARQATTTAACRRPDAPSIAAILSEAVKRFQRRHGLTDDGIVTPASWRR